MKRREDVQVREGIEFLRQHVKPYPVRDEGNGHTPASVVDALVAELLVSIQLAQKCTQLRSAALGTQSREAEMQSDGTLHPLGNSHLCRGALSPSARGRWTTNP